MQNLERKIIIVIDRYARSNQNRMMILLRKIRLRIDDGNDILDKTYVKCTEN